MKKWIVILGILLSIPVTADGQSFCSTKHVRLDKDWMVVLPDGRSVTYSKVGTLKSRIGTLDMHAAKLDRKVSVGDTIPSRLLGPAACNMPATRGAPKVSACDTHCQNMRSARAAKRKAQADERLARAGEKLSNNQNGYTQVQQTTRRAVPAECNKRFYRAPLFGNRWYMETARGAVALADLGPDGRKLQYALQQSLPDFPRGEWVTLADVNPWECGR